MIMLNRVLVIGNLTRDPELRHTPEGTPVTAFTIAMNRRGRTPEGEAKEDVTFIEVKAWQKTAEDACRFLHKGSTVLVEGRLKQERWEAKDGGGPRSKIVIHVQYIQFLDTLQKNGREAEIPTEDYQGESDVTA